MKAIETEYNGILFRSRLEARWAIYFDQLGIEWVYEPECFVLNNGLKYTPDFYLPQHKCYVEIKPDSSWMNDKYHTDRYTLFAHDLVILDLPFPDLRIAFRNNFYGEPFDHGVVLVPMWDKYSPFFYSGSVPGSVDSLYQNDFLEEIEVVKQHRFYK